MEWTQEKTDFMLFEFDRGQSIKQISKSISEKFQELTSKNAIIGKLHRMNVTRATSFVKPITKLKPKPEKRVTFKKIAPLVIKWIKEPPSNFRCSFYELTSTRCHWPFGDAPPYDYCGATVAAQSYCSFHHQKSLKKDQSHVG